MYEILVFYFIRIISEIVTEIIILLYILTNPNISFLRHIFQYQPLVAPHWPIPHLEVDLYGIWQRLSPTPPLIEIQLLEVLLCCSFSRNQFNFTLISNFIEVMTSFHRTTFRKGVPPLIA